MNIIVNSILKSLNKGYLKHNIYKPYFDNFKTGVSNLLENLNKEESEEHNKNLIANFLEKTNFKDYNINTKGNTDLVIKNKEGEFSNILIEAKNLKNKSEFPTKENLNVKALHELVLYYLREKLDENNNNLKHLIITNGVEWFILDASFFYDTFYKNNKFLKEYTHWKEGKKENKTTEYFYNDIAKKHIDTLDKEIEITYFNIKEINKEKELIYLYKLLSPTHLLKESFVNDSNTLDKDFYNELLYIMGLEEVTEKGKNLIKRRKNKHSSSLIERTISLIKDDGYRFSKDELFENSLALVINWVNRILFLKLLEGKIYTLHKEKKYKFLSSENLQGFNQVNNLFFNVLAKKMEDETRSKNFNHIPYLNSSLFDKTELEKNIFAIDSLSRNIDKDLKIFEKSIFNEKKQETKNTLEYLLDFLEAYDFSDTTGDLIKDTKKTIINTSVLGLIFEKINGYKDGSVYTPSFITMYMSRESIQKMVINKFKEQYPSFEINALNCIENLISKGINIDDANSIINNIKICDPSVGSGHFLVSALNEIIFIKHKLDILKDEENNPIKKKDYSIRIENDELIITNDDDSIFEYTLGSKESLRVQKTIFQEKRTIIENCLFGVDINPNSVKICQLRLWIELLKNSYYKLVAPTGNSSKEYLDMETLPNIDINIKCGNSLVSKLGLKTNPNFEGNNKQAIYFKKISEYRDLVTLYKDATLDKSQIRNKIREIKDEVLSYIVPKDKDFIDLDSMRNELAKLQSTVGMFEATKEEKERFNQLNEKILLKERKCNEKNETIYKNSFEWRIEFPEVLDDNGDFKGFDLIIGNPPYIQLQKGLNTIYEKLDYTTFAKTGDIYQLFYEKGIDLLKKEGILIYITSNKWMRAGYGEKLRDFFTKETTPIKLIDLGSNIFDNVTVDSNILFVSVAPTDNKKVTEPAEVKTIKNFPAYDLSKFKKLTNVDYGIEYTEEKFITPTKEAWTVLSPLELQIKNKIEKIGTPLKDWDININRGVLTGYNEAFIIDTKTKERLYKEDPKSAEIIKPILRGRDIKRYTSEWAGLWIIGTFPALKLDINNYPSVKKYLENFGKRIHQTGEKGARKKTNNKWFETQDTIAYHEEFEKEKIVYGQFRNGEFDYKYKQIYVGSNEYIITSNDINLKYIISILNSPIINLYQNLHSNSLGGNTAIFQKDIFIKTPIPKIREEDQKPFIDLVDKILRKKEETKETINEEREIDKMVYSLYGLTEEEIRIVEGV